jgi:hypothetical protein
MSIRSTLGKLMVIGIALAILGIMSAKIGPQEVRAQKRIIDVDPQKRTTEVEPGLVKIVPAKPVAPRPTMASKPAPAPLSLAEKQRLLQSVLTSLRQQDKANPALNLSSVFPLSVTPSLPRASAGSALVPTGIVLSPARPSTYSNGVGGRLTFLGAVKVGDGSAMWDRVQGVGSVIVHIRAVKGNTYVLDFGMSGPIQVDLTMDRDNYGGTRSTHMEISGAQGHILVPFFASSELSEVNVEIEVYSESRYWFFYSVEILSLNYERMNIRNP